MALEHIEPLGGTQRQHPANQSSLRVSLWGSDSGSINHSG